MATTTFDRGVIVDTQGLGELGVGAVAAGGRFGDVRAKWDNESAPGRQGVVLVASEPVMDPRPLDLRFVLEADSRANLLALRDDVRFLLAPETAHTFRFVDDEAREISGVIEQLQFGEISPDLAQTICELRVQVLCADPREYATSDTVVGSIQTSDTDLPLGPVKTEATIVVSGSGTFTLTYKDSAGATVHTLDISGAAAPVTIDMATGSITDNAGEAAQYLVAGSDFPFSFDPQHGDFVNSLWPTLACSSGTAEATYRKAY